MPKYEQGDLDSAIASQQRAIAVLHEDPTQAAATTLFSTIKLAGFLREAGRFAEAERLLLAAQDEQGHAGTEAHPGSPQLVSALVALYEGWGRPDEATRWRAQLDE